ncbi:hypothetical protein CFC21_048840 [Triticum aestivum]|uniref:DNA2/NAM7 helicase-like C-terminal domain-containing protein n=2 Tax=Triticum aestivum TaxID=4565 RepID=A0A3B6JNN5_WHEAT|nr:hypothetical protein CFC21_048840 [Triticum aestivum]
MIPCISLFPNAQFYDRKILHGSNVLSPSYDKDYTCLLYGSYTHINVTDGREDKEGTGNSRRNMVEVVVVLHLIQTISRCWKSTGKALSIGVVSSYSLKLMLLKIDLIRNTTHVMAFMCASSLLMVFKEKRTIY